MYTIFIYRQGVVLQFPIVKKGEFIWKVKYLAIKLHLNNFAETEMIRAADIRSNLNSTLLKSCFIVNFYHLGTKYPEKDI